MKTTTPLGEILIQIAHQNKNRKSRLSNSSKTEMMKICSDQLQQYNLNYYQIQIIALAWQKQIEERMENFEPLELLSLVFSNNPSKILSGLDLIVDMEQKGIFEGVNLKLKAITSEGKPIFNVSKELLLNTRISFSEEFIQILLSLPKCNSGAISEPYNNYEEYLSDWLEFGKMVNDYFNQFDSPKLVSYIRKLIYFNEQIEKRANSTNTAYPLKQFIQENQLDFIEKAILAVLLSAYSQQDGIPKENLYDIVNNLTGEVRGYRRYLEKDSKFLKNGWLEIYVRNFLGLYEMVTLKPEVANFLLNFNPEKKSIHIQEIIHQNNLLSLVEPQANMDNLILPPSLKKLLLTSLTQFQNEVNKTLLNWRLLTDRGTNASNKLIILLYGAPGTGKTFAAHAVAHHLGRQLLVTDISKILSCFVGESEKNLKSIFETYRRITEITSTPPVLLFNEADQLLNTRINVRDAVDQMYNHMQNIILEEFENFRGVLICTTNLPTLLDAAFSRRFDLKLEFPKPDVEARKALWEKYLNPAIPGANTIDIQRLAEKFELTGGQITLVIKNAAIEAASRPEAERFLTQADIEKYCQLEIESAFDSSGKKIGFINDLN